jgi:thymidine kinase
MFAGKSTELVRRLAKHERAHRNLLVVKYKHDTRYSEQATLSTHDKADIVNARPCKTLNELYEDESRYRAAEVIGIDEGQFFPDLVEFCDTAACEGKTVIVSALDATFQRQPFGSVCDLVAVSDEVVKLSAVCEVCNCDAIFSWRRVAEQQVELIGGENMYMAVCRSCFVDLEGQRDSAAVD